MTVFTLIKILGSPSITILMGQRDEGKTATGMKFLEEAHEMGMECYVVGIPEKKWHLLPDFIHPAKGLDDIPDRVAIFIDEAYLLAHARTTSSKPNIELAKILGVARQKKWTMIFAAHLSRKLDPSIVADCDNQMFKKQTLVQMRFERKEIKDMAKIAHMLFKKKIAQGENSQAWAVIFSEKNFPGGLALITYKLPTFWSEELSNTFSGVKLKDI